MATILQLIFFSTLNAAQGVAKCVILLTKGKQICSFLKTFEKIYADNKAAKNYEHLKKMHSWSLLLLRITKLLYMLYVACGLIFGAAPFLFYMITGELSLSIPLYLPTIDPETSSGLLITAIFHGICSLAACLGYGFFDVIYAILTISIRTISVLIKYDWEKMNLELEQKAKQPEIKAYFRNLCIMHNEMTEYVILSIQICV